MASHVELSDIRHITGRGETPNSVKFPKFHIFDANWSLKMCADSDDHRISLSLSHKRRRSDDPWEMTGIVGFRVEINGKSIENVGKPVDCRFSHVKNRLEIENFGVLSGNEKEGGRVEVKVQIFMKIHKSMGIQLRYYMDFSKPLPIFSDTSILCSGRRFHVNRMIISMASPLFFRHFLKEFEEKNEEKCELKVEGICGFLKDPGDFRRILNLIYPPHLVPKQWIKEPCWRKQLADIYRILEIAKSLELGIAMETADEWIAKYGRFDLGKSIILAQDFGLRRLMGTKITSIRDVSELKNLPEFQYFSQKTKSLIFDHLISLH